MPAPFAHNALVADEFQLSSEERLRLGLEQPAHPAALTQGRIRNVTVNRIRHAMSELAALNVDNVDRWLADVAKDSPAKAIELFVELMKFSAPQLKAVAVDVRSSDGSVKHVSTADLEKIVSEQ